MYFLKLNMITNILIRIQKHYDDKAIIKYLQYLYPLNT